jgi:hypothetical protein
MAIQCIGTRKDGSPCKGTPLAGRDYCFAHDETLNERRRQGSIKGGANRSSRARARKQLADAVMTIGDLDGLLCRALVQVAAGKMEPSIGTAMATIAKTVTAIRSTGELERRLEELERAAGLTNVRRLG